MRFSFVLMVLLGFVSNDLAAAHFRQGGFLSEQGILESMRIEPRLPAPGEGFTVRLTGSWPEINPRGVCLAPLELSEVVIHPGNMVQISSLPRQDPDYCDQPPAHWDFNVAIPANAWEAVSEEGYLRIEHNLFTGINELTGINQIFDMRLGTHEVPAFIGSGFWISEDLPFEGVLVEQQGSRVLFYGLEYDRDAGQGDAGEPVWQLVAGEMYGNSTLGRSYRYDWQFDQQNMPLPAPAEMDLLSSNDSGAIIVDDYNHIRVFTRVSGHLGIYHAYKRVAFGIDASRLPNYVPPLGGRWTLYGFNGQAAVFTSALELLEGSSQSANQYRFASADGDWQATCTVTPPGDGDCIVERASDGAKLAFPMTAFQGNLARGGLDAGGGALDGVLVRAPWQLPAVTVDQ